MEAVNRSHIPNCNELAIYRQHLLNFVLTDTWTDRCTGRMMDGLTNVLADQRMDWQMYGLTDGWTDRCMGWPTDGPTIVRADQRMDQSTYVQTNRWTNQCTGWPTDGTTDVQADQRMDQTMHGLTNWWINRCTDWPLARIRNVLANSDWEIIGFCALIEWGLVPTNWLMLIFLTVFTDNTIELWNLNIIYVYSCWNKTLRGSTKRNINSLTSSTLSWY